MDKFYDNAESWFDDNRTKIDDALRKARCEADAGSDIDNYVIQDLLKWAWENGQFSGIWESNKE